VNGESLASKIVAVIFMEKKRGGRVLVRTDDPLVFRIGETVSLGAYLDDPPTLR
jgi:hypothetical protein